jgi:hypothetical protein
MNVPYGNWGKATYLEPLTKDFPQYGIGGATQVLINGDITVSEIWRLH